MKRGKSTPRRSPAGRKPGRAAPARKPGSRRGAPAPAKSRARTRPAAPSPRTRGTSRRAATHPTTRPASRPSALPPRPGARPAARPAARPVARPHAPASARTERARRPVAPARDIERGVMHELEERLQILTAELEEERRGRIAAETAADGANAALVEARAARAAIPPVSEPFDDASEPEFVPVATEPETDYEDYDDEKDFLSPGSSTRQRRAELDRERADRELELGEETYWLVCPKCGEHLVEHEFDNVKVERCEGCGGLWADKGELDLLIFISEDDRALAYRTRGLMQ
jgi:hypothetical protein